MISIETFVVFLPFIGAVLSNLKKNIFFGQVISITLVAISGLLSWYLFITFSQNSTIDLFSWISVGSLKINWALNIDRLTTIMFIVVTTVSTVVHLYSTGYMEHDKGKSRFFSYLSLFTFFMLVLVTSGNFLQLFCGWEGVGLCSYLLIGFWFEKYSASKAAIKAFVINRVGDFCLLVGIILIYCTFDTLDFIEVFDRASLGGFPIVEVLGIKLSTIHIICILLFICCMGKSAQIGLHTWLPDAMEGPTPVSALIHAATMVTAGVFLVARCSPLFELSLVAREVMIIIGSITCFFAATVAIAQNDIKKIIAYSTCSQLGYMFIACGSSAYNLGIFHLMTHAFFKALLFLCAGNVIYAMNHEQDIHKMGGCYKKIPFTYALMWIGSLALTGIFPFAGFYSKDLIIENAYSISKFAFIIGILVVFLTSLYSWRLMFLVFHGKEKNNKTHKLPKIMLLPLLILAFGSIFSGVWGENILSITDASFWQGSISITSSEHSVPIYIKLLPMLFSFLGMLLAYLLYVRNSFKNINNKSLVNFLRNKWYFDEIYEYLFVRPVRFFAIILWKFFDVKIIDSLGIGGIVALAKHSSINSLKLQTGRIFDYAVIMVFGFIISIFYIIFRV
ncbi:MAG: NADH-quinone oxidoreductase subunit L [Candidatus Mesenet longicola]|uniref:NADH-quinone oxidoreductase subunit L n=1 Tax=Candidatus Mesenet longicola TaxID=1892558 RepID=A0A8J3HVT6_9RICK|nr:MAG: NADH-quinone oxidoreductase subunit L [Candidatus Mesenet longicola]GHM59845.1 MAG: NADH-quinone oxidoreductase subunit L [Candidatus Mesenet longicola]